MTREEQRRASARRTCAACLRQAACIGAKQPGSPAFVVSMHARLLSRDLWRCEINQAHKDAIKQLLSLAPESALPLRIAVARALWASRVALGENPTLTPAKSTLARSTGEICDFSSLYAEIDRAQRCIDAAIAKADVLAAGHWHERLLALTRLGRELPVLSTTDAALLLEDLWNRAKHFRGGRAREFRVACRRTSRKLLASQRPDEEFDAERLTETARRLDGAAPADMEYDFAKVVRGLKVWRLI